VHDRQTAKTTRASVASNGHQGNDSSGNEGLSISADGRFVAFESSATNLVSGDTNNGQDVFVHDRQTGETTRVSVDSQGDQGSGDTSYWAPPAISADGRYIALSSFATLVPGDANSALDVFVHAPVALAFNGTPASPNPVSYTISNANSDQTGTLALVMLSCSGTSGFPLPNGDTVYLTLDACTLVGFTLHSFLSAIVGSAGTATTPSMIFPPGIPAGLIVYSAAVTIDLATSQFLVVTYPIWFVTQ